MKRNRCILFLLILCLVTCVNMVSANNDVLNEILSKKSILENEPDNKYILKEISFLYLHQANFDDAVEYGNRLLRLGNKSGDDEYATLYAHIILGQAYLMTGEGGKAYSNLLNAEDIAQVHTNDSALCSVYNGLGLYYSNIEKDYYKSLDYFFKGIESAKRSDYTQLHNILLINISGIYYLKDDPVGLVYSLDAYEMGHQKSNPYLIFAASSNAAYMYFLLRDYDNALKYIKEAEFLMKRNDFYNQTNVYALYGNILLEQNNVDEAVDYFQKGMDLRDSAQTSSIVYNILGYAKAKLKQNEPDAAIEMLKEGLDITYSQNNSIHRDKLLEWLSIAYESKGEYNMALEWQRRFQNESDSLFNSDKERAMSDLRIKYDTEHNENLIKEAKLDLMQKTKNEQLLIALLIGVVLVVVFLIVFMWNRNKFFNTIIHQYQARFRLEKQMQKELQSLKVEKVEKVESIETVDESANKYIVSSLTEEKSIDLFSHLEKLMRDEKMYHDNFLTREKVAEALGSNRTYLSQIINQQTSLTFTQYINEYRINEALKLLNEQGDSIPLKYVSSKVGFSSTTTFYKAFQDIVGMSPSQYKNKSKEIYRLQ